MPVHDGRRRGEASALTSSFGGGGAPTIVVAASDASELSKSKADSVCDGTANEVIIQAALNDLPASGGRVELTEGTFNIDAGINVPTLTVLAGLGMNATTIIATSAMTGMIVGSAGRTSGFQDFKLDGNSLATYCVDRPTSGNSWYHRVWATDAVSHGMNLGANNAANISVTSCWSTANGGVGIEFWFDGYARIADCYIANNTSHGIESTLNVGDDGLIIGNTIVGNGGWGIDHATGQGNIVAIGNILDSNTSGGINGGPEAHNFIDGVMVAGDHDDTISAVPQSDTFYRSGTLAVDAGTSHLTFPYAVTIVNVRASVDVAPTGLGIIVDVNNNGTSIYPTSTKPDIAIGATKGTVRIPDTTAVAVDDDLTVDIDQIGSTIEGEDLTVTVYWVAAP